MNLSTAASNSPKAKPHLFLVGLFFLAFPAVVSWWHGPKPDLIADHIVYFRAADLIRETTPSIFPESPASYRRHYTDNQQLSVLLAYAYDYTKDHIRSCRIVLYFNTFIYLWSAWLLFSIFVANRWYRLIFVLLSALHVSYGATYWGFTDFSASLSRSFVIPMFVLVLWSLLRFSAHGLRIVLPPLLLYLTLIHLSAFHFLAVCFIFEIARIPLLGASERKRRIVALSLGLLLTIAALLHLSTVQQSSFGSHIRRLRIADHQAASDKVSMNGVMDVRASKIDIPILRFAQATSAPEPTYLSPSEAWKVEMVTMRWRNFPPSISTIAQIGSSIGVIGLLAGLGWLVARRHGKVLLDQLMVRFAVVVMLVAVGPQALIWIVRRWVEIYPINTEEFRILCWLSVPLLYFVYRLFLFIVDSRTPKGRRVWFASLVVVGYCAQPGFIIPHLPRPWRETLFTFATRYDVIDAWESPRTIYARQVLALESSVDRFYYGIADVIAWLSKQPKANRVLGNRPELVLCGLEIVGSANGFVLNDNRLKSGQVWQDQMLRVNKALKEHDRTTLGLLARRSGANFVVVPWPDAQAVFTGTHYSVLDVRSIPLPSL